MTERERYLSEKVQSDLTPLTGDASSRKYYRLFYQEKPAILADYKLNQKAFEPFLEAHRFFCSRNFRVPAIFYINKKYSFIILENLGNQNAFDEILAGKMKNYSDFYLTSTDIVSKLQSCSVNDIPKDSLILTAKLDYDKLFWELNFMKKYYLEGLLGIVLSEEENISLENGFRTISDRCAKQPVVLCHRDFHSKNLYFQNGKVIIIDYQDLQPGPYTYDIASLLRDSYTSLDENFIEEMKYYFHDKLNTDIDYKEFNRDFELTALQRNLKAIGTFASQKMLKNNDRYLQFIAPTLANVMKNLNSFNDELGNLKTVLEKHIKELL